MAKRRKLTVWLSPMHLVGFECDEVQFAGPTMIIWRDEAYLAQFQTWLGWAWQDQEPVSNGGAKLELASVSPIRRDTASMPGSAPENPEAA